MDLPKAPLPEEGVERINMRELEAEAIVSRLLEIGAAKPKETAHGRT